VALCRSDLMKLSPFLFIPVALLLCLSSSHASFEKLGPGARAMGMGGSCIAVPGGGETQFWNPAGIASSKDVVLSVSASRLYGLRGLTVGSFSLSLPICSGSLGIGLQRYGNSLYSESVLSTVFAGNLLRDLSLGVSIRYNMLSVKNFGSSGTVSSDFGLLVSPRRYLGVAIAASNLTGSSIHGEPLSRSFTTGFAYRPLERITVSVDLYKEVDFPYQLRVGVEYGVSEEVIARFGFGTAPSIFSVGIGLKAGRFYTNYALSNHITLGSSHHISSEVKISAPGFSN